MYSDIDRFVCFNLRSCVITYIDVWTVHSLLEHVHRYSHCYALGESMLFLRLFVEQTNRIAINGYHVTGINTQLITLESAC